MSVTATRAESAPRIGLLALILLFAACSRKNEEAAAVPGAASPDTPSLQASASDSGGPGTEPAAVPEPAGAPVAAVEGTVSQVPRTAPGPAVRSGRHATFLNNPPTSAWPGRPWVYRPALATKRAYVLRLLEAPEGMVVKGTSVHWTPAAPGRFQATLEAAPGPDSAWGRITFVVNVKPLLSLVLKPLPPEAAKGDTVGFDLGASVFPPWAGDSIEVRFDYEGDGKWDTESLPLGGNLRHRHIYSAAGRFVPRVEARYLDREVGTAVGSIVITGAVAARLVLQPDTVEPGGAVSVDAAGSHGDGRLVYRLDLDGDGKMDWSDSATGKATLKAPTSGRYEAVLTVRNSLGQEGKAAAGLRVNARPKALLRLRKTREHMAAPVEVLLEGQDADDSLRAVRINFTGAPDAWQSASRPDSSKGPGRWRKTFRHAYGKAGKFIVTGCAASSDGREGCGKAEVEIFNAPPAVDPAPTFLAVVGKPAEIVGTARDPDGSIVKWEWDLDGDGRYDLASGKDGRVKYTFARKGSFSLGLRVTTADGMTATAARRVEVRNP